MSKAKVSKKTTKQNIHAETIADEAQLKEDENKNRSHLEENNNRSHLEDESNREHSGHRERRENKEEGEPPPLPPLQRAQKTEDASSKLTVLRYNLKRHKEKTFLTT